MEDASVVCRQLGFSRWNAVAQPGGTYRPGTGPIWGTNVVCNSEEGRLVDCSFNSDTRLCTHSNDAGVTCNVTVICNNGDLRLRGGNSEFEGRVELCWNETWGTICDGFWSTFDANVACRQLGLAPAGAIARTNAYFGQGTGPIWLDDLLCRGNEQRLIDCPVSTGGIGMVDFCNGHADDAGVTCREPCESGTIRLVNGAVPHEGRVEVCRDSAWGTVCDDFWSVEDAQVACRWAGFSAINATALSRAAFGQGTGLPIYLDDLRCTGSESTLFDCPFDPTHNCNHFEDAGVRCLPQRLCNDTDLRLVGGVNEREGRIEICFNETWGTVCSNGWTSSDANVACRQLGFSKIGASALTSAPFGAGSGMIYRNSLQCSGSELRLVDCAHSPVSSCTHQDDAGLRCNIKVCDDGSLRLVGGSSDLSGRVEICYNEAWGTICDNQFDSADSSVICAQLGFSRNNSVALGGATYGQGTGRVLINSLRCIGNETYLTQCDGADFVSSACPHSRDIGVTCRVKQSYPTNVQVVPLSNVSVSVMWSVPREFTSSIIKYRATCNSSRSLTTLQTQDSSTFNLIFNGLSPYTNYSCCVETLYTDESENADACAPGTTLEGVPGPPRNLVAEPSLDDCSQVVLRWGPPAADEQNGVIRRYRVRISALDTSGYEETFVTSSTVQLVADLRCCSDYQFTVSAFTIVYGAATGYVMFRTYPDLSDPININAPVVVDESTLRITWMTPQSVLNQGLSEYTVAVTSSCLTGDAVTPPQQFVVSPLQAPIVTVQNLRPFTPYQIRMTATICRSPVEVYNQIVYTRQAEVMPPVISTLKRSTETSGVVSFSVPPSEQDAEYFEILLYIAANGTTFDETLLVDVIRTNNQLVTIPTLNPCSAYFVRVSAVTCGTRVTSDMQLLNLHDTTAFSMTVSIPTTFDTCKTWIATLTGRGIPDIEDSLNRTSFEQCKKFAPCYSNSSFNCLETDSSKATFSTLLVGSNARQFQSSTWQLCLVEWRDTGTATINIGGQQLGVATSVIAVPSTGGDLYYVWVIIAVVVVGIAIVVVLVIVIFFTRRRKQPMDNTHNRMYNEEQLDETQSAHSIGVVENPLYAEDEGTFAPSFAVLSAKEKEAEAEYGYGGNITPFSVDNDDY